MPAHGLALPARCSVRAGVEAAGVDDETTDILVVEYEDLQLMALKAALLLAALLVLASLPVTRNLPDHPLARPPDDSGEPATA